MGPPFNLEGISDPPAPVAASGEAPCEGPEQPTSIPLLGTAVFNSGSGRWPDNW